jgi:hypothetical protein
MQVAAGRAMTAGVVPAAVALPTEGVLKTMTLNKLRIVAAGVVMAGLVPLGVGVFAMSEPRAGLNPGVEAATLTVGGEPAQDKPGADAPAAKEDVQKARASSSNNLKMIALAMHNFASGQPTPSLPPAAILSKDGKPLLSWRVALLAHGDQKALYEKFHLDERWDSPHNKALLDQIPEVYTPVIKKDEPKGSTYYQVFFGPGAVFDGDVGTEFTAVRDGTSNTLMVAEAAKPVPWTKPEDLPFDNNKPLPKLGGQFKEGFHVAFMDGSVLFLDKKIDDQLLRALITRNGGEVIAADAIPRIPPE